jgi:glycerol kinase
MTAAIALDLGSTFIKAARLDRDGKLSRITARAVPKVVVTGGRYESDALLYAQTAESVLAECMAGAPTALPLGLCSQRSSFLIWEDATGMPVTPLISWQDDRGSRAGLQLHRSFIRELTGLPLTPYYFGPKLSVLLHENPQCRERLERGELRAGTLDTFLIWRWTGKNHFITDASMAARTQLMDIKKLQWSPALCELFEIPLSILPAIKPSAGMNLQLDNGLTLQASLADQSAALIASVSGAQALVNLGTGGFVIRDLPANKIPPAGYLHTLVFQDNAVHMAVEGTLNSIAAALAPYPFTRCLPEQLALDGIFCIAEPAGMGAPYFTGNRHPLCHADPKHPDLGICFSSPVDHLSQQRIAVLLLEAIIFRVARILEEFHSASAIERVYLSGGLSGSSCLQQGIARCVSFEVFRLQQSESSLQGAAMLAAGIDCHRKISPGCVNAALIEKYRRWKVWLDELLA